MAFGSRTPPPLGSRPGSAWGASWGSLVSTPGPAPAGCETLHSSLDGRWAQAPVGSPYKTETFGGSQKLAREQMKLHTAGNGLTVRCQVSSRGAPDGVSCEPGPSWANIALQGDRASVKATVSSPRAKTARLTCCVQPRSSGELFPELPLSHRACTRPQSRLRPRAWAAHAVARGAGSLEWGCQ